MQPKRSGKSGLYFRYAEGNILRRTDRFTLTYRVNGSEWVCPLRLEKMVNELVIDASGEKLKAAVVERLLKKAPFNIKWIFLNCEMQDTPGGMAMSDDMFAVVKPVLRGAKRVDVDMDADTFKALVTLGRIVLAGMNQDYVTLDLIVDSSGSCKAFWDDGPLRRIGGGGRDFKTKHKEYAYLEPWLNEVD